MKPISFLPFLLACGLVLSVASPAQAQRAGAGRAGGGGGGGGGRTGAGGTPGLAAQSIDLYAASSSRGGAFNDLELTELTRLDEQVEAEIRAVRAYQPTLCWEVKSR